MKNETNRRWIARHPERHAAHILLASAVRSGRIVAPEACEDCGATSRLHGHHEDYSTPLVVVWLCARCHRHRHVAPAVPRERKRDAPGYVKPQPRTITEEQIEEAREMQARGLTYRQIAHLLGVTVGTAYKRVNETPYK